MEYLQPRPVSIKSRMTSNNARASVEIAITTPVSRIFSELKFMEMGGIREKPKKLWLILVYKNFINYRGTND